MNRRGFLSAVGLVGPMFAGLPESQQPSNLLVPYQDHTMSGLHCPLCQDFMLITRKGDRGHTWTCGRCDASWLVPHAFIEQAKQVRGSR